MGAMKKNVNLGEFKCLFRSYVKRSEQSLKNKPAEQWDCYLTNKMKQKGSV